MANGQGPLGGARAVMRATTPEDRRRESTARLQGPYRPPPITSWKDLVAPDIRSGDWRSMLARLLFGSPTPGQAIPPSAADAEFLARARALPDLLTELPLGNPFDPTNVEMGPAKAAAMSLANQRLVDEARRFLQRTGPVERDVLAEILRTVPAQYAHKVTEGLPGVPPPQRTLPRILHVRDPESGLYTLSPATGERVETLTRDLGAALPHQGTWTGSRGEEMLGAFAGDVRAADLYGDLFAGLSTRTMVPKNAKESIAVWREFLRHPGRGFTHERLRDLGVGNVGSKRLNVLRAIHGLPLEGPKVSLFSPFMSRGSHRVQPPRGGHLRVPVPDVHNLRGLGSEHESVEKLVPDLRRLVERHEGIPARGGGLTERDYVARLNEATAEALQRTDPEGELGRIFAQFWNASRAYQGLPFQGGPSDILRPRGLMERGAMLEDRALTRALNDPRPWLALLGLGGLQLVPSHGVGAPPPPPPEAR